MEYIPLGWAIKDSVCLGKMEAAESYTKNGTTLEFSDGSKITHGNYILESDKSSSDLILDDFLAISASV